jgi:ParB-like chromosome segregation protein Spo0J
VKIHPVAELFPMISASELQKMADSIKREGLLNPCVRQEGTLLDGRNRLAACRLAGVEPIFIEYTGDDAAGYIIAQNIHRRHLDESQRSMVAARLATMERGRPSGCDLNAPIGAFKSQPEAAEMLNVGRMSVQRARVVLEHGTPELAKAVDDGRLAVSEAAKVAREDADTQRAVVQKVTEQSDLPAGRRVSGAKAVKEIKAEQDKRDLAAALENIDAEKRQSIDAVCDLRICSCRELFASGIRPDAVITDPPYSEKFLPVFSELAVSAALAEVPLVAVMSGQSYLPEVMERLCQFLRYRWMMAYMMPGGTCRIWPAKIDCQWKPVLLFGEAIDVVFDIITSEMAEKRFHEWGQSVSGMSALVERLTKPGQLVCDPFLGAGSTAVASLKLGRRFIGCDIDAACVQQAREWVAA